MESSVNPVPQLKQNLFDGSLTVPQLGQDRVSSLPQLEQNLWLASLDVPQF